MKTEVLTAEQFRNLYFKFYENSLIDLKEKIHYFSYNDCSSFCRSNDKHTETTRLIVSYNNKDITGICFFAWWGGAQHYSLSYVSTHVDYKNQGIAKKIVDELFSYFSKTYPTETLHTSGYSVDGWKYLRKLFLNAAEKHNVLFRDRRLDFITEWTDENRALYEESKKLVPDEY